MGKEEIKIIYNSQLAEHLGLTEEKLKEEIGEMQVWNMGKKPPNYKKRIGKQFPSDVEGYSVELEEFNDCLHINLYKKSSDGEHISDVFSIVSDQTWCSDLIVLQKAKIHNPELLIYKKGLEVLFK